MKKFCFLLSVSFVLVFIIINSANAQLGTNQWKFSNPKPFGFWGWQISYADDNTALVVGGTGGIAKTTDGGATWEYFAYTTTDGSGDLLMPTFNDVQFVNSNLAYAVGDNGVMIKSTNGGINWTSITTPFSSITDPGYNKIHTVWFTDANTGYIGGDADATTNQATIYKTTNGGSTWQPEFLFPAPAYSYYQGGILKIRFAQSGVGYAGGANGLVWKYQNGAWSDYSITPSVIYANMDINEKDTVITDYGGGFIDTAIHGYSDYIRGLDEQNYRAIAIMDDTSIVVGGQNNGALIRINTSAAQGSYVMLNNGQQGNPKYSTLNSPQIYNLICRDGNFIAGTSSEGKVLVSKDKGFKWTLQDVYTPGSDEADLSFFGIDISASGRVGVCGKAGIIADSTTQWRKPYKYVKKPVGSFFNPPYALTSIHFVDANYGIAAGSGGAMLRTADGGNNWEDISNPSFNSYDIYTALVYSSVNTVIASASNGQLYKSADRGTSFDLLYSEPTGASIDGTDFINEDTGWFLTNVRYPDLVNYIDTFHQFIYHTTDGGITWDTSNTVFPYPTDPSLKNQLTVVKFLNRNIGYAGGYNGNLYKTTDGGLVWTKLIVPVYAEDKQITSIEIVDENVVYIAGDRSYTTFEGAMVMKTINGGNTWAMCNTGLPVKNVCPKILMYNANEGLLFGYAVVYSTKDGGASWTPFYTPLNFMAGDLGIFTGATFAPIAGCSDGICQKVFAVADANIMKLDADVVLPVKFSNLTGTGTTTGNQLFWTAFAQEEVKYFEIQRSADGTKFNRIGDNIYPGSLSYESYKWLDATAGTGNNFYRIKAVEKSGAVFYTNVVKITTKKSAQWDYAVSNGSLILNNIKVQKGNITATVINTAGQVMASRRWNQDGGAFNQALLLPPSAKGICFVKVDNEGTAYSFKIFIQ